ncbi:hypothetical protein ACJJTC_003457 [Scirpophaga incertulas]
MKLELIYLTLWSVCHGAYVNRMATVRVRPTAFRPGVTLHRPWSHQRLVPAASHRVPYVVYRNPPQRYTIKHYGPASTRNVFAPWKGPVRHGPPTPAGPAYEFVRAASSHSVVQSDGDSGAIHMIPAPNLSFSGKPIVVIDADTTKSTPEPAKPAYEVTEKFPEPSVYQPKIEIPVGFSKPTTNLASADIQSLLKNGAALQFASDYGLSIALPQSPIVPQQFTMQSFNNLPTQQDIMNSGVEGIVIPPNALYQADPNFMQKLQSQLLQRFPSVEFIPYAADGPSVAVQPQAQLQIQRPVQNQIFLLQNEEVTKQTPTSFEPPKNVVQRETQQNAIMSLIPQSFSASNISENQIEVTSASQPQNVTVEVIADSQPSTTTVKYIVESTTPQLNITPIYYAQIGQSVGSVVANSLYAAINDVRAAAALEQVERPHENITTTTTESPEIKPIFIQQETEKNSTVELKPMIGVPFTKTADSVNIAYTLLRANNQEPQVTKEGTVYAGQIVEATISEDQDFNKEKATLLTRRAPLRLIAVTEKKDVPTITTIPPKVTVVKAKIPPKSKLTFDDKTGEPVLRIYASYVDTPLQKELMASKLNLRNFKDNTVKKHDTIENWTSAMVKKFEKTQGHDANQVTDFGVKLRSRSDDYIPLFEDYEEEH